MKIAILDANYHHDLQGLSATWLNWELQRGRGEIVPPAEADFLLVTASCAQNWRDVRRVIAAAKSNRAKIVLGGAAAYTPAVFGAAVDAICVGEGSRWIRTLLADGWEAACDLPETWQPGDSRPVIPNTDFAWDMPPLMAPDGIVRIFASRGCRYRCLFCQTGWETTYRTNPDQRALLAQIKYLKQQGRRIVVMTNDGAEASVVGCTGHEFVSMRVQNLKPLLPISRDFAKNIRLGVEGVSERLRRAVGKPVLNDDLLSITANLLDHGIQTRWFFIIGLPGERPEDYEELRYLVREAQQFARGFVFMHFHPFIPKPATPLGILPLHDEYQPMIADFKHWFFTGTSFTQRIHLTTIMGYKTRLDHACADMAATEPELRRGWFGHDNPNWRVQYNASPEKMRQLAGIYARKVDLSCP